MRVLWFSNTPSLAAKEVFKTVVAGGSWIESLEIGLMAYPEIELGIVFSHLVEEGRKIQLEESNTQYYMVPRHPYKKISRLIQRVTNGPLSRKPLQEYLRIVDEFKPDLVLFFGSESDFPLIIPHLKVPSAVWFQGNLTVYDQLYQSGIPLRKTLRHEKLKDFLLGNTFLHDYWSYRRMVEREKEIFSYAQNFIGRTDWDRRVVSVMAPQADYYHCEDALRPAFFESVWQPHRSRNKFVITTTIRENLHKGLECILETAMMLQPFLGEKLEWRVIGISENSALARISRTVTKYPKSNKTVKLLGSKSGPDLVQELLNADVHVHPSHIENSPNSVKEAMLMSLPVITTNVGGTPSLMTDGKEGLLVQNKDNYSMAGAILEIYRNPEKAAEMGKNARKLVLERNDIQKICADLLNIFDQMLERKESPISISSMAQTVHQS